VDGAVLKTAARLAEAQGLAILEACAKPMSMDTLAALLARAAAVIPDNLGK
jgi:hypothetical protein